MRRHRQQMQPLTEINVTNLLDTAFVLLMAFMIVAPSIKHGIDLEMPTVGGKNIETRKTLTIVIEKKKTEMQERERLYIDGDMLAEGDPIAQLKRIVTEKKAAAGDQLDVLLEADKSVSYEAFMEALSAVKSTGIEKVGLMSLPPPKTAAEKAAAKTKRKTAN